MTCMSRWCLGRTEVSNQISTPDSTVVLIYNSDTAVGDKAKVAAASIKQQVYNNNNGVL